MRGLLRRAFDRLFTGSAYLALALMAAALLVILGPMLKRGMTAVFFRDTIEFRKMQYNEPMFNRGDGDEVAAETDQTDAARQEAYDLLNEFAAGIDSAGLISKARHIYRELKKHLRNRAESGQMSEAAVEALIKSGRDVRNRLTLACEADTNEEAIKHLDELLDHPARESLTGTRAEALFSMAAQYRSAVQRVELSRREQYAAEFAEVKSIIYEIFGPAPGEMPDADLMRLRYGATRWDRAQQELDKLLWKEQWVPANDGTGVLKKVRQRREELFRGTSLEPLFGMMERDIEKMMLPRQRCYWQYFIDPNVPGHYFGGIGPELYGTIMLSALAMLFSVPVGITTAAFLVEFAKESVFVRFVRICINTLAGVPSIVYGLFGLAFFVIYLQPKLGLQPQSSIFAGSLTLAVLVLPLIIRASEEAIRAVPRTYKEASLSLGAGEFRTFMVVTLPAALPGVLTGIILSLGRAAGETAPLLFTAAVAVRKGIPDSIFNGGTQTLSYGAYDLAVNDKLAAEVPHNRYGMVMILILLVLILNIAAIILRSRIARKLRSA